MATYLPGDAPFVPDIAPWSPDFSMIQKTLANRQGKYDQNFGKLQGMYNSMLNSALTNDDNQVARESYLKTAQEQLTQISGADLSIQQNEAEGEKIFDPFYSDNEIIADMAKTQKNQKSMATAEMFRTSKDKELRDQYSNTAVRYIQNGVEQLKTAKRGTGQIQAAEAREFVPFRNVSGDLFKAAKDAGFEVEYTQGANGYIVSVKNGARSVPAFYSFAKDFMSSGQYDAQMRVTGTVAYEDDVKILKQTNPFADDATLRRMYGEITVGRYKESAARSVKMHEDEIKDFDAELARLLKDNGDIEVEAGSTLDQRIKQLKAQRENASNQLKQSQERAADYDTPTTAAAKKLIDDIAEDPVRYNVGYLRETTAQNWARVAASSSKETWKVDEMYLKNLDFKMWNADYNLKAQKQAHDIAMDNIDYDGDGLPDGGRQGRGANDAITQIGTDANGSPIYGRAGGGSAGGGKMTAKDKELAQLNAGSYKGVASNIVVKEDPSTVLANHKQRLAGTAIQSVFGQNGVASTVLKNLPGVTAEEVTDATNAMNRMINGAAGQMTDYESAALVKVRQELERKTGITLTGDKVTVGPALMRNAIMAYSQQYLAEKRKDPNYKDTPEDKLIYRAAETARTALAELDYYETQTEAKRKEVAKTGKWKLAVKDDGTEVTGKDIDFGIGAEGVTVDGGDGKPTGKITLQQIQDAYTAGKLKITGSYINIGDGQGDYTMTDSRGSVLSNSAGMERHIKLSNAWGQVLNTYGTAEKFAERKKNFSNEVATRALPAEMRKNGAMGHIYDYAISKDQTTEMGQRLAEEIVLPSNHSVVKQLGNDGSSLVDADLPLVNALQHMTGTDLEEVLQKNARVITKGPNGKPMIQLTISDDLKKGHTLEGFKGRTLMYEIADGARGTAINSLASSPDLYIHGRLLRGEKIKSDPIQEAAGFKYSVTPSADLKSATINMTKRTYVVDKDGNGSWEDKPWSTNIEFSKMTPDQIMDLISDGYLGHVDYNYQQQQLAAKKQQQLLEQAKQNAPEKVKTTKLSELIKTQ